MCVAILFGVSDEAGDGVQFVAQVEAIAHSIASGCTSAAPNVPFGDEDPSGVARRVSARARLRGRGRAPPLAPGTPVGSPGGHETGHDFSQSQVFGIAVFVGDAQSRRRFGVNLHDTASVPETPEAR